MAEQQADKKPESAITVAKIALAGTIVAAIVGATATITAAVLHRSNPSDPVYPTTPSHPDRASTTGATTTEATTTTTLVREPTPISEPAPTTSSQSPPVMLHVVYQVTGTAQSATYITYTSDGEGSGQQDTNAEVPWSKEFAIPVETFAQVSAQNGSDGTITCAIIVNGKTIKTATATGEYAIASCNATIE